MVSGGSEAVSRWEAVAKRIEIGDSREHCELEPGRVVKVEEALHSANVSPWF